MRIRDAMQSVYKGRGITDGEGHNCINLLFRLLGSSGCIVAKTQTMRNELEITSYHIKRVTVWLGVTRSSNVTGLCTWLQSGHTVTRLM